MRSCSCVDRTDRWPFEAVATDKDRIFTKLEIRLVTE